MTPAFAIKLKEVNPIGLRLSVDIGPDFQPGRTQGD